MTEHERRFHGTADRLRSPERIRLLEVDRVVSLAAEGLAATRVIHIGTGTGVFARPSRRPASPWSGLTPTPACSR